MIFWVNKAPSPQNTLEVHPYVRPSLRFITIQTCSGTEADVRLCSSGGTRSPVPVTPLPSVLLIETLFVLSCRTERRMLRKSREWCEQVVGSTATLSAAGSLFVPLSGPTHTLRTASSVPVFLLPLSAERLSAHTSSVKRLYYGFEVITDTSDFPGFGS